MKAPGPIFGGKTTLTGALAQPQSTLRAPGIDPFGHNNVTVAELNPVDVDDQKVHFIEPTLTQRFQLLFTTGGEFTADLRLADVLAGHASFAATHEFYLAAADDMIRRAKAATTRGLRQKLVHFGADAL